MEAGRALLVVALAFVLLGAVPAAAADTLPAPRATPWTDPGAPSATAAADTPRSASEMDLTTVIVATTDPGELARAVSRITGTPLVESRPSGFATPLVTLPRGAIEEIRGLPSTVGVFDYVPPTKHLPDDPEARSLPRRGTLNWNSTINHGAPLAWARGITGDGVKVAIVDDGVDFGHPDLQGTVARVEDPASRYYGWPMAFDPFSLATYLRQGGDPRGTWYADTSSTDRNVTHPLRVDGRNDFWTDGSELVATDPSGDIGVPDFDLVTLYVTQDPTRWYVGFSSRANHTTMAFGLYINTTAGGAGSDPLGKYVAPMAGHEPEFAVYMTHNGLQPPGRYELNDTIPSASLHAWNPATPAWEALGNVTDAGNDGQFAYSGFKFDVGEGFVEIGLPKALLGDPQAISLQLFTAGTNASHAQDTVYSDPNVAFASPDWSPATTTLSAMTIVGRGYWRHTYVRGDDTVNGQPNVQFTWPVEYVVPPTSRSGAYLFGDHPDENYPLTRVLVVDESVSGVYDTVYVDLDHNKDFRNDKPLKRYGKYDGNGNWHPANWTGVGTIFDETAWADIVDPAGGVEALAWSPDGRWLASGGRDHAVVVWNTTSWAAQATLNGHHGRVTSVAWSPSSGRLAVGHDDVGGGTDHSVDVWRVPQWSLETTYTIHARAVTGLAFNPAGSRIASSSEDGTAKTFDIATRNTVTLGGHAGPVTGVSWSASNTIATSSEDGSVKLWSAAGANLATYPYGSPLNDVEFDPGATILAVAAEDGNVVLFDAGTGSSLASGTAAHFGNPVLHVDFNGPGDGLVSSSGVTLANDPSLATWSVVAWNNFALVDQRFAAHTDASRGYAVPAAEWSTTDALIASGGRDAAVKTWDPALALSPVRTLLGHTIGSTDATRYNGGDGIADVSGGLVYFLAQNGTYLPYSQRFLARTVEPGLVNTAPENGTVVAFMGALDLGASHGTLMASSLVGRGVTTFYDPTTMDEPSPPQVYGIAPDAKLIPVANIYVTTIFDGWWFAVEGYDGVPGTGDEAQIVANSFGFSSTYEDGWDFYSRFADWVSIEYAGGSSLFTVSAGNDGNGYGTVTGPGSAPGVVTAGASTDFFYRKWAGLEGGASQSYGDLVPFSSRGPTALGRPDPDVLANGRMSFGASPLNMVLPSNGAVASELWSGTSLSSPLAAGILALVYEAYEGAHGTFPDAETAKAILMSGADDVNYDVFSQGAGFANADRATRIAGDLGGIRVAPTVWTPGTYRGQAYEAFVSLMTPGSSDSRTFSVRNSAPAPEAWTLSDSVFRRTGTLEFTFPTPLDAANAPIDAWHAILATSPAATFHGGPGLYRVTATGATAVAPVDMNLWINADLVRISARAPQLGFDPTGDGANDYRYMLDVYDWTETDWGTVLPDTATFADLNRVSINHPEANLFDATVHNAPIRTHDGLVFGVRLFGTGAGGIPITVKVEFFEKQDWNWLSLSAPQITVPARGTTTFDATVNVAPGTPAGTYEGQITLRGRRSAVDTFTAGPGGGPWIRLSRFDTLPSLVLRNGSPVPGANLTYHPDAGLIEIRPDLLPGDRIEVQYDYFEHTTIPVAVSVGSSGPEFQFGGSAPGQDDLFGNFVGAGFGNGGQAGDFRFYYTEIADDGLFRGGAGLKFYLDTTWVHGRTDVDVFAFGTGGAALLDASGFDPGRYGPYLVGRNHGGSEISSNFFTTTGGPEEIVAPSVSGGLNVIALHAVRFNGTASEEPVSGRTGLLSVNPSEVRIVTNDLAGSRALSLYSTANWPGVGAVSAGPSAPQRFVDLRVQQDVIEGAGFTDLLARGSFTHRVLVQRSALIFDVHITSDPATTSRPNPDLDLGIFLDGKGAGNAPDGVAQVAEFVAQNADADANEQVRMIKPVVEDDPDTPAVDESLTGSPYLIKVLGFTVPWSPYGTFNMDITLVQGEGFTVGGTTDTPVPAYTLRDVALAWNLPGSTPDGTLLGALYVGPSIAPLTLLVPIEITVDRSPPSVTGVTVGGPGVLVNDADGRTVNSRRPSVIATFADPARGELDPASVRILLDGKDVTSIASVDVSFAANEQGIQGRWTGTLAFTPASDLADGVHSLVLRAADLAGNEASEARTLVVDTVAPAILLDGEPLRFTRLSTGTVSGTTEPRATVTVGGTSLVAGEDGRFSAAVSLAEGRNDLFVRSADWFDTDILGTPIPGNEGETRLTIVYDVRPPTVTVTAPPSPTSGSSALIRGRVVEPISALDTWDPRTLSLTANGRRGWVMADGSFEVPLDLDEGANGILVEATDLAGNVGTQTITVVRDSTIPTLEVDDLPSVTLDGTLTVSGTTDPDALVFVNGIVVRPGSNGSFSRDVALSGGPNVIVVRAEDLAGNAIERSFTVTYAAPASLGPSAGLVAGISVAAGVLVGLLVAFLLGRGPATKEATPEGPTEEEPGEPRAPEPPEGIATTPVVEPEALLPEPLSPEVPARAEPAPAVAETPPARTLPSDEERLARIEAAYRDGKITREAYERNLRALGREPPPAQAVAAPSTAGVEELAERIRAAFEHGRITREAYEANLARLGLPVPRVPATTQSTDERISRIETAYREGRITREAYVANLERLRAEPPAPPPPPEPTSDDRRGQLERAYREGRISREMYESNLARLASLPGTSEPRAAALRRAMEEGRITRDLYARNVARLLGLSEEPRAAALVTAFAAGRIDADLFERNLRRIAGAG